MRYKHNSGHFKCSNCKRSEKIYFDNFLHHLDKLERIFAYYRDPEHPLYYQPLLAEHKPTTEKFAYWNKVYVQCPGCKRMSMEFYQFDLGRRDLFDFENFMIELKNSDLAAFEYRVNDKSYVEYLSGKERNYFKEKYPEQYRKILVLPAASNESFEKDNNEEGNSPVSIPGTVEANSIRMDLG